MISIGALAKLERRRLLRWLTNVGCRRPTSTASPEWLPLLLDGQLRLAGKFEEQHFADCGLGVEWQRAVTADEILRDSETRTTAVDLMHANVGADVKLSPAFDENCTPRFCDEQLLDARALITHVINPLGCFQPRIVERGRHPHFRRRQFAPA